MIRIKMQSFRRRILATCATALLVFGLSTLVAFASNPVQFIPLDNALAVAASPERLLAMTYLEQPRVIYQITPDGTITPFATLPERWFLYGEADLDFAPALGDWPAGYIFVTNGNDVYKIDPAGTSVTHFATLPTWVEGLCFDEVGSFGYDMLVTGGGQVYRVSPTGTVVTVGVFGCEMGGPEVAPMSFGPYGGWIFVAAWAENAVMAMSPEGDKVTVLAWPSAMHVHFVPDNLGTLGNTGLSYFGAVFPLDGAWGGIAGYPLTDFEGMSGKALVGSEFGGGTGQFWWNGSEYVISTFCEAPWSLEVCDFVENDSPRPIPIDIKPRSCPNPINTRDCGLLPVAILGLDDFDVRSIDPATIRLEGVAPIRSSFEDVATPFVPYVGRLNCTTDCWTAGSDGYLDMSLKFNTHQVVAALGRVRDRECRVLHLTASTYDGRPIQGEDVVIILSRHH